MMRDRSRSMYFTLFASAAVGALSAGAAAQISLEPAAQYPAGVEPSGVALGDFNGDGHIDIATTVDNPDRVVTLLNDGQGQFTAGPTIPLPNSSSPQDIIAGDFDADGDDDLAVALRDPAGAVRVYANDGAGQFTLLADVPVEERPRGLSKGDVNDDGVLDLAVANRDSESASVIFTDRFTAVHIDAVGETRSTALGDFNGDGWLDLAVSDHDNRVIRLFEYDGSTFTPGATLSVAPSERPDGVIAADLNGDGLMDVAAATGSTPSVNNDVAVFINLGGSFDGPFYYATDGDDASDLFAADFDCDGQMDIIATSSDSDTASVLPNTGNGAFGAPIVVNVGDRPDGVEVADLNGDSGPDAVVANRDSNDVSVIVNASETCDAKPIPGDLDGDGAVDGADLGILLSEWGPCADPDDCPADLNGDGTVGGADLGILLSNWTA